MDNIPFEYQTAHTFETGKNLRFVDFGFGSKEEAEAAKSKLSDEASIALIERGKNIPFTDKAKNAIAAGAKGIIFYNSIEGGEDFISAKLEGINVPVIFLRRADGLKLKNNPAGKVIVTDNEIDLPNPNAGRMSDFSSWGVSGDEDAKPEITAYGGEIYSTLNDGKYGNMSGTSMSAPKVSGASVLLMERLDKEFPEIKGAQRQHLAKAF